MNRYSTDQGVLNALSFDVEEWFHGLRVSEPGKYQKRIDVGMERILATLDHFGAKATFFVLASVAGSHKRLLRYLAAQGHEIGSHGLLHVPIYEQSREQFRQHLQTSVGILEDIVGEKVSGYRAPFFSITARTLWALDEMADMGLSYDSSIFPIVMNPRYGIPTAPRFPHWLRNGLLEIPISTLRLRGIGLNIPFSGGFYARFAEVRAVRWGIRRLNAHRRPALVYFHSWELDPQHPRVYSPAVSPLFHFTHYHNLCATQTILDTILGEFHFAPLRRVAGQYQTTPFGSSLAFDYLTRPIAVSGQPGYGRSKLLPHWIRL